MGDRDDAASADGGCSRAVRVLAALALVAATVGCDLSAGPVTGCPSAGAYVATHPDETVVAGGTYAAWPLFPSYPCAVSGGRDCGLLPSSILDPLLCPGGSAQATCIPALTVVEGPPGSAYGSGSVLWSTGRADEGKTVRFEVETRYPDGCQQLRAAWNVTVLPGPPTPVLHDLVLDREDVRPGESVTVVATFEGGQASWDFGLLESGVPATSPPLLESRTLQFTLEGGIGETSRAARSVTVWRPPVIRGFFSSHAMAIGDTDVTLRWDAYGHSGAAVDPAPTWSQPGTATVHVTATTTYTLSAWTPVGDVATATLTIEHDPDPVIRAFAAAAATLAVGEAPSVVATFEHGVGALLVHQGAGDWNPTDAESLGVIQSGVPFPAPAQRGSDRYLLVVSGTWGRQVSAELAVPVVGPGSFTPVAPVVEARPFGALLVPLPDGRLLLLGGASHAFTSTPSTAEVLDLAAGTAAPWGAPDQVRSAAALEDGRVLVSEQAWWSQDEPRWDWPGSLAVLDLAAGGEPTWVTPADPAVAEQLRSAWLVPLGGDRVLSLGIFPAPSILEVDVQAGSFEPVSALGGLGYLGGPACRLGDGRALLSAGAAIYDPASRTAAPVPFDPPASGPPSLLCLSDGTALRGGEVALPAGGEAVQLHRFDPASGTWSWLQDGPPGLSAAVELADGRVLLLARAEGWLLDLQRGALERAGRLTFPRVGAGVAARLAGGEVVVLGGGVGLPERFTP